MPYSGNKNLNFIHVPKKQILIPKQFDLID